jgi:hypothetical protein
MVIVSAFSLQNGSKINTPFTFTLNTVEILRLGFFVLFQSSRVYFGWTFLFFNVGVIAYVARHYMKHRSCYMKYTFPVFCCAMIIESVMFILISIYAIGHDSLKNS